ncbi:MAG TPA: hypothetical protein PKH96_13760 [Gemmatimonadaceae bacterium]|nr:hypothetical protein [Gemmatimonadaceae bacterium]
MSNYNSIPISVRELLCVLLGAIVSSVAAGQELMRASQVGDLPVAVVAPTLPPPFTESQRAQLEGRLFQLATSSGMAGSGNNSRFVLTPSVTLVAERTVESGLRATHVATVDLSLTVRQMSEEQLTFGSTIVRLSGGDDTKERAINSAFASLNASDPDVRDFLRDVRQKIVTYYETNCERIRADARSRAGAGMVGDAVGLLAAVPREARSCNTRVAPDLQRYVSDWLERDCEKHLRNAKANIAAMRYDEGVSEIALIEPSTRCAAGADPVIDQMDKKVEKTDDRRWSLSLKNWKEERETVTRDIKNNPVRAMERTVKVQREATLRVINSLPRPSWDGGDGKKG